MNNTGSGSSNSRRSGINMRRGRQNGNRRRPSRMRMTMIMALQLQRRDFDTTRESHMWASQQRRQSHIQRQRMFVFNYEQQRRPNFDSRDGESDRLPWHLDQRDVQRERTLGLDDAEHQQPRQKCKYIKVEEEFDYELELQMRDSNGNSDLESEYCCHDDGDGIGGDEETSESDLGGGDEVDGDGDLAVEEILERCPSIPISSELVVGDCPICNAEFEIGGDEAKRLSRSHHFRRGCILRWLAAPNRTYPLCSRSIQSFDI